EYGAGVARDQGSLGRSLTGRRRSPTNNTRAHAEQRTKGENDASCHREALAREVRTAESSARRGNRQRHHERAGLRRRACLGSHRRGRSTGLGGEGLQARHRGELGEALQETGTNDVSLLTATRRRIKCGSANSETATWKCRPSGSAAWD